MVSKNEENALKEEKIREILLETKESYSRNLNNSNRIDNKLERIIIFITAITLIFIQNIDFPKTIQSQIQYIITAFFLIYMIYHLFQHYRHKNYNAIDPNILIKDYYKKNKNKYLNEISKLDILEAITGTTAINIESIRNNINEKDDILKSCSKLIFIIFISIIILNLN